MSKLKDRKSNKDNFLMSNLDTESPESKYYKNVSKKYNLAKYITIFFLGIFVIVAILWGSKFITMDSIMYLSCR